jgi:hypothetical protein
MNKSIELVRFCNEVDGFYIVDRVAGKTYENMGATIIDGILQSGVKYKTVVAPRVQNYLNSYSDIKTTTDFAQLILETPIERIINWKPGVKPNRIKKLIRFFLLNEIETEVDLFKWFQLANSDRIFLGQDGVGCKTLDYFKILSGNVDETAIDRHLYEFISLAGIQYSNYADAAQIVKGAAKYINVEVSILDHSIWRYMSERA